MNRVVAETLGLLEQVAPGDEVNLPVLLAYLRERVESDEPCELRTAVRWYARTYQPKRYLEIGVRRGWSLLQVADVCPECEITGIDIWTPEYGGAANEGEAFVRAEVARLAPHYRGELAFVSERSQDWLSKHWRQFDMITVDGDHTGLGALMDLKLTLPMLRLGGVLLFDDLVDGSDDGGGMMLTEAWEMVRLSFRGYEWRTVRGLTPVGVAVRWQV